MLPQQLCILKICVLWSCQCVLADFWNVTSGTRILENQYFEQKVDNFNPVDTRIWQQRYHINGDYYNGTCRNRVFLMLGGEWQATTVPLTYGNWFEAAKKYDALMIYLEHRFYGLSQPFSDWSTENLKYLSAHQALEDAANFIHGINKLYNISTSEAKWIVFGGSYAGTLAAWLRYKYPHLVTGAIASSAPLEAVLDFNEFLQSVRNSFASYSLACVDSIKYGFSEIEELFSRYFEDANIYQELNTLFQLCNSTHSSKGHDKGISDFYVSLVADVFFDVVNNIEAGFQEAIKSLCSELTIDREATNPLSTTVWRKIAAAYRSKQKKNCTELNYDKSVADHKNITIVASSRDRPWAYQCCTEFGSFTTSSQRDPIFGSGFNLKYFTDFCTDVFGGNFTENVTKSGIAATNIRYGGRNITMSNIVYFYGSLDPFRVLGRLETTDDVGDTVIIVNGAMHTADMHSKRDHDPEGLDAARLKIEKIIGEWLGVDPSNGCSLTSMTTASSKVILIIIVTIMI